MESIDAPPLNSNLELLLTSISSKAIISFQKMATEKMKIKSFEIDCRDLDNRFHATDIRESKEFKATFDILKSVTGPVLYWFEILSDTNPQRIVESIKNYKNGDGKRATPAIKKRGNDTSRILYVGKVKKAFCGRLITHLGYLKGSGQTQGLQLGCWAKDICLTLRLNFIEFDKGMADYMTILENGFAEHLRPLIGKHK